MRCEREVSPRPQEQGVGLPGIQPMRHLTRRDRSAREAGKYRMGSTRNLLDLISDFFRGAIISDNNMNLIILTTEVYSRSASVDSHCEATEFSVPSSNLDISCGIYNKSDGSVEKTKLIIGTKTINLSVTVSVEISKDPVVHVGPGVEFSSNRISLDSFKIFVRTKEQDRLIKDFSGDDFLKPNNVELVSP